ncbi:hypothetical protein [Nocardioides zeae]|uniref:Netrin module non-TIMP type domain-containing protein n=1 Tax=Nocardioides zeae TaxID=1457234 RepID=A0A6P0HPQ6_9ACTN|nr:hypothetical protein [Nocardioides zeae]NEN80214.1 hypothetical protein [Nocardioides zeae]
MNDRPARRRRVARAVVAVTGGLLLAPAAVGVTATPTYAAAPASACDGTLEDQVAAADSVVVGTVTDVAAATTEGGPTTPGTSGVADSVPLDVRLDVERVLAGDLAPREVQVAVGADATGKGMPPEAGVRYVVLLGAATDAETGVLGAETCSFLATGQLTAVEEVIAQEEQPDEAAPAEVTWSDVSDGDTGPSAAGLALPGLLLAAIGVFGLAGTALLARITGRRR